MQPMTDGITPEQLVNEYPRIYHMAEYGSWPSIQTHGLLSTTALLDLFEKNGEERFRLEACHRSESITIEHAIHGKAVLRDQKSMSDGGLLRALQNGLTPEDWYRSLNSRVFFWLSEKRLFTLMNAKGNRNKQHTILVIDTKLIVARHASRIALCPINSGCTKPFPAQRGKSTFQRLADYPYEFWKKKRRSRDAIVELTVDYSVPDIRDTVVEIHIGNANLGLC